MSEMRPKSRQELWAERHATHQHIESAEPDYVDHDLGEGRLSTDAVVVARRHAG